MVPSLKRLPAVIAMPQSTISTVRVNFAGHDDHLLTGRLEMPATTPRCFATFSHCFTCTKDTLAAFRISKALANSGIATLRFDFTGLGDSDGDFADSNFSTTKLDLHAAVRFLEREYASPQLLIGHSLGGTTALACAADIDSVTDVVTIASPSQPRHVLHHFGKALDELRNGRTSSIVVAGQSYNIKPQFINDIETHDMQHTLAQLNKPVLIFDVTGDALVGHQNALDIEAWCAANSTIITLDDTDHVIADKPTAIRIAERIEEQITHA